MTILGNTLHALVSPDGALQATLAVSWWAAVVWATVATVRTRIQRRHR